MKKKCDECKKEFNHVFEFNNKLICKLCLFKKENIIKIGYGLHNIHSIEKALLKIREVRLQMTYNKYPYGIIRTPRCLIGKKVRLVIVED